MFKSVSWIVALALVAAPVLPVRAEPFGAPPFGRPPGLREVRSGGPQPRDRGGIVIRGVRRDRDWNRGRDWNRDRNWDDDRDRNWDRDRFGRPINRGSKIIIAPVRPVIVRPRFDRRFNRRECGTVIYGSPIPSPVLVNPRTGVACY